MTLWPRQLSLRARITLGVVITLGVLLGVLSAAMHQRQKQLLMEANKHLVTDLSNVVADSLHHAMLEQSDNDIQMILDSISRHYDVMSVSVVRPDGVVYLSSDREAATHSNPLSAGACSSCDTGTASSLAGTFITTDGHGRSVLRGISPIPNEPSCQKCHGKDVQTLGFVVSDFATGDFETQMASVLRSYAIWNLVTILIVAAAVNLLLNWMVVSRLARFMPMLERFRAGDFAPRLDVKGYDEIATLAQGFNRLAEGMSEKAALEEVVRRETERLGALQRVIDRVSRTLDLEVILQQGLAQVVEVSGMDAADIRLWDEERENLHTHAQYGLSDPFVADERDIAVGECFCGEAVESSAGVLVADPASDARMTRAACRREGFASVACVSLRAQDRVIGILTLYSREERSFDPKEKEWLKAIGNHLGIAIENALLYQEMESRVKELTNEVQSLAVLRERDRLAREMHDGFAQSLGYLHLQLVTTASLVEEGRTAEASRAIAQMEQVVGETYDDVREVISNLRSTLLKPGGLVPTLEEYVPEYGLFYDLEASFVADLDENELCLPQSSEVQLLRIVQEALSNVRKHAQAQHVWVSLATRNSYCKLQVKDDGIGFDSDGVSTEQSGHFGLLVMQERATDLGGTCAVESVPRQGTTVTIEIPIPGGKEQHEHGTPPHPSGG
jgi:nitrate/nitrite-specific signal transduction histidine kinase